MLRKKPSLSLIIDKIDWMMIEPAKGRASVLDGLFIKFKKTYSPKTKSPSTKVHFRIGFELAKTLGWQKGDTIAVAQDPDNLMNFLLQQNNGGQGYKMSMETGTRTPNYFVAFAWKHNIDLENTGFIRLNYVISRNRLACNATDEFTDAETE